MSSSRGTKEVGAEGVHRGELNVIFQRVYGFERSKLKGVLTYISYALTIGWVRLFFHWYPQLHLYATHKKCPLNRATKLLITVRIRYAFTCTLGGIMKKGTESACKKSGVSIVEEICKRRNTNYDSLRFLVHSFLK